MKQLYPADWRHGPLPPPCVEFAFVPSINTVFAYRRWWERPSLEPPILHLEEISRWMVPRSEPA